MVKSMPKVDLHQNTYRLIPSHFPPIQLFENLLNPQELDAAYALESLTNDRLMDEAGIISLVPPGDRIVGPGTTVIMAAFTHIGKESRFTRGEYGVYYAGLDLDTALAESSYSRCRFLSATNEEPQILTMRCYECVVSAPLIDVRDNQLVHDPDSFAHAQAVGRQARAENEMGILYRSVRHQGGECIAALKPTALTPPAIQSVHYQYHWDGQSINHISTVTLVR